MKAIVRTEVEKVRGVTRTWFEWTYENEMAKAKTLIVEVDFNTDPNSPDYNEQAMLDIGKAAKDTLTNKTSMLVSYLRIVPQDRR